MRAPSVKRGSGWMSILKFDCVPRPDFFRIDVPFPPFGARHVVMKMKFTSGFVFTNVLQPLFASSALQFGHHGAHRCTTVMFGDLIASATWRSIAADSAA